MQSLCCEGSCFFLKTPTWPPYTLQVGAPGANCLPSLRAIAAALMLQNVAKCCFSLFVSQFLSREKKWLRLMAKSQKAQERHCELISCSPPLSLLVYIGWITLCV